MRIVAISDTHELHSYVDLPPGKLLIHAGDFTNIGRPPKIEDFLWWLKSLDYEHIVFIAGNHDITLCPDRSPLPQVREAILALFRELPPHIHYLENSGVTIDGLHIWGSPYSPEFAGWGFMKPDKELSKKIWSKIPKKVDILVTHGSPASGYASTNLEGDECGSYSLARRIKQIKPRVCIFGHIHEGYSTQRRHDILYINASICERNMRPSHDPISFDLEST